MTTIHNSGYSRLSGLLFLAAGTSLLILEAVVASAFPGYSYATNYVSDLGVPEVGTFEGRPIDSPLAALMNFAFVLQGILMLSATVVLARGMRTGSARWVLVALAAVFAIGFITIAVFHGSEQAEANGTVNLHFLGGGLLAAAGNAILIVAGFAAAKFDAPTPARVTSIVLGLVGIFALVLLVLQKDGTIDIMGEGALERGALYSILLWEILVGGLLVWSSRRRRISSAA